ncbi:MAG: universal stress protein [Rhodocyclaceae bacterium]|nr:universal stress protein [Rhodocyclaceae bacterium]
MFKHILLPIDGSELSLMATRRAAEFASEIKAAISILFVKPEFPISYYGDGAMMDPTPPDEFAKLTTTIAHRHLKAAEEICAAAGVTTCSITETSDAPYEVIVQMAQDKSCDLIFMASHGRRGISGLLLGSETQKVLTHSKVPVLVYR